MNSDFSSKTNQNIIKKLDQLITTVNRQTMILDNQTETIENKTEVIDQLRTELDSKFLENELLQEISKKLKEQLGKRSKKQF